MTSWMCLVYYTYGLVHIFTGHAWRRYYQNCWGISSWQSGETCGSTTTGLLLILPVTSEKFSPPLTVITGLGRAGLLLGFPFNRPSQHWTSSCGATWQTWFTHPVDSEEYVIARKTEGASTIRHKSGIFERTIHSLLRRCRLCTEVCGRTLARLF